MNYGHDIAAIGALIGDPARARILVSLMSSCAITRAGATFLERFGIDLDRLTKSRRPLCRPCLDWSEPRPHLDGGLGAAILDRIFTLRWARRETDSRAVTFSSSGERALRACFEK